MSRARELDTVKLMRDVGSWPAGTVGAVVSVYPDSAMIEVVTVDQVDEYGLPVRDLLDDLVSVPYVTLEIVERAPVSARSEGMSR